MVVADSVEVRSTDWLTAARFLFAAGVLFYHYSPAWLEAIGAPALVREAIGHGDIGVPFFFVLSGFVLSLAYEARPLSSWSPRWAFWVRRFARVYPAYLLAIALALAIDFAAATMGRPVDTYGDLGLHLMMMQGWSGADACSVNCPGWSISAEAFFYVVFPFVLGRPTRWLVVLWSTVTAATLFAVWNVARSPVLTSTDIAYTPFFHLGSFLLGILAFRTHRRFTAPAPKLALAAASTVALWGWLLSPIQDALPESFPWDALVLLTPLMALIVLGLACVPGRAPRSLVLLGNASYAMYIFQEPLSRWRQVDDIAQHARFAFPTYFLGTVVFAVLMHVWVEEPLRRAIIARWRRARQSPASPDAAPAIAPDASPHHEKGKDGASLELT